MATLIATARERQRYRTDDNGIKRPTFTDWVRKGTCPFHVHVTGTKKTSTNFEGVNDNGWVFWCNGVVKDTDEWGNVFNCAKGGHRFVNLPDPEPKRLIALIKS